MIVCFGWRRITRRIYREFTKFSRWLKECFGSIIINKSKEESRVRRRTKTAEEIGRQTMRALAANNQNVSRGGINRQGRILRANAGALLPIYQRQGNRAAVNAMRSRLGLTIG